MTKNRLVLPAAVVGVACCLTTILPSPTPLRASAAVILLFVLPGYALLLVSRLDRSRDTLERLVVILGAGTSVVVVLSIAIAASPIGLSGRTVALFLTAFVLAGLARAGLRVPARSELLAMVRPAGGFRAIAGALRPGPASAPLRGGSFWRKLAWSAAATLTLASLFIAGTDIELPRPAIIQLWMLPEPSGANIGIYNGTPDAHRYRLVIRPRGVAAEPISIDVPLTSQLTWRKRVAFPPSWLTATAIDANLYGTASATSPIRAVWIDLLGGSQ